MIIYIYECMDRVRSSVGLERMATNYKVGGSNPSGLNIRVTSE